MTVRMADFRARYPDAQLPDWLDDVDVLEAPAIFAAWETQAWVLAIHAALDREADCLEGRRTHRQVLALAGEHLRGFGPETPNGPSPGPMP